MCSENDRVDVVDASLATLLSELIFFGCAGVVNAVLNRPSNPLPNWLFTGMFATVLLAWAVLAAFHALLSL